MCLFDQCGHGKLRCEMSVGIMTAGNSENQCESEQNKKANPISDYPDFLDIRRDRTYKTVPKPMNAKQVSHAWADA